MRDGDHAVDAGLAARLIAAQAPALADLPMTPVSGGTDNLLYRVGPGHAARFPLRPFSAALVTTEARWLPHLAPHLPLPVPLPLIPGTPALGYPYRWAITGWIPGHNAHAAPPDQMQAATALARFIAALHAIPVPADAPPMPAGGHLAPRDAFVRQMIAAFRDEADPAILTRLWDACLALPRWTGPAVWVHADLHPLNLLTQGGRLRAVIDWGALCAGDPAHDLICAWTLLDAPARARFRAALAVDDATWARGRALAFSKAVQAVPWYRDSNPPFRDAMRSTLARVIADRD